MPWLLNFAYFGILLLASPILLYRRLVHGKYRDGWAEKFLGRLPRRENEGRQRIWFHAVSVGEVLQLVTVVRELLARQPRFDIVITTTTSTGLAVATAKFPDHLVCYYPLDFSWAVRNAVERINPDAVVLVELELWPNFIREVDARGIPLLLINGRVSENSFRGYRKLRFLMRSMLGCFDRLAVQNATYAERLRQLDAPRDRITVTGSIKFDAIETNRDNPATNDLRNAFGLGDKETILIAGSTHAPEEEIALHAWRQLREKFPSLRLILVPRHKERFEEVATMVESNGCELRRRSEVRGQKTEDRQQRTEIRNQRTDGRGQRTEISDNQHSNTPSLHNSSHDSANALPPSPPVLLLDTLGELSACWGLADLAFVGGSLTTRGGQNMIEPAGYGAAVLFGPNTRNFRDVVELLLDGDAARVVADERDLVGTIRHLLMHREELSAIGSRAQQLVLTQRGATARTVDVILESTGKQTERTQRDAA